MKEFSILKDLSYKEKHWHEDCFVCSKCRTSLVDKQFGSKADRIYCGPCYDAQFATRCDGCGDVFRAGTVNFQFKEVFGNSKKYSLNQTSFRWVSSTPFRVPFHVLVRFRNRGIISIIICK